MTYDRLRHLADSWGLIVLTLVFLILIGWTFLPAARGRQHRAATSIFEDQADG